MFRGQKNNANVAQFLVHIFCYINNAINFLFYGISSQKYREELKDLFCGSKCFYMKFLRTSSQEFIQSNTRLTRRTNDLLLSNKTNNNNNCDQTNQNSNVFCQSKLTDEIQQLNISL